MPLALGQTAVCPRAGAGTGTQATLGFMSQTLCRSQHPLLFLTVCVSGGVCVCVNNSPHHFLELPVFHECLWPRSVTTFATSQECWGVGCP